jgi:hypothetical protein
MSKNWYFPLSFCGYEIFSPHRASTLCSMSLDGEFSPYEVRSIITEFHDKMTDADKKDNSRLFVGFVVDSDFEKCLELSGKLDEFVHSSDVFEGYSVDDEQKLVTGIEYSYEGCESEEESEGEEEGLSEGELSDSDSEKTI